MQDIITRIDSLIEYKAQPQSYLFKDDVVKILEYIIDDVPEDRIFLESIKFLMEKCWSFSNNEMNETFDNILATYGIIDKRGVERKMIVEKRGVNFVKKIVKLSNINEIMKILDK